MKMGEIHVLTTFITENTASHLKVNICDGQTVEIISIKGKL